MRVSSSRTAAILAGVLTAVLLTSGVSAVSPAVAATSAAVPGGLAVDSVPNAAGVASAPRFSWTVDSGKQGFTAGTTAQSAQVALVGSNPAWSKTIGGQSTMVSYDGPALTANTRYQWTVRVKDSTGTWSKTARSTFTTGPIDESGWNGAQWIAAPEDDDSSPQFRAEFQTQNRAVRSATLTVAGLGRYQAYLNGAPLNTRVLDAAAVDYNDRIPYVTHVLDINRINHGGNAIGIVLANGWYRTSQKDGWGTDTAAWRGTKKVRAILSIQYSDGSRSTLVTKSGSDSNPWRVTASETTWTGEYGGETVDLRAIKAGWNAVPFDASTWSVPVAATAPTAPLRAQVMPGVQRRSVEPQVSAPVKVGDSYVYTLVNNISGWAKVTVNGSAGQTIQVDYDETLGSDGLVSKYMNYKVSDSPRRWQHDEFILRDGRSVLEPRFTYKGFKYLQLTGPSGWTPPAPSDIEIYPLATAMTDAGSFSTDDPLLTWLHQANRRTLLNNIQGVQTDCPQREKMGWLADIFLSGQNTLSNFDAAAFLEKTLADIRDGQVKSGTYAGFVPDFVPTPGIFSNDSFDDPWWSGAIVNIAWDLYRYRGDKAVLVDNYDAMKAWVDYLGRDLTPEGVPEGELGDWLAVAGTPVAYTSTALWYLTARTMTDIATLLGEHDDAEQYADLASTVRDLAVTKYFKPDGALNVATQTAISLAIALEMHPPGGRAPLAAQLAARIAADGGAITTGIVGTRYLFQALNIIDRNDLAYDIVSNPNRGFAAMKAAGATTIWEAWNAQGLSQNHPALTSVDAWLYQAVGGIRIDQYGTRPGIRIAPTPVGDTRSGSAAHRVASGSVTSSWTLKGTTFTLQTNSPLGVRTDVALPYADPSSVRMDGEAVPTSVVGTRAVIEDVASGPHTFTVTIAVPKPTIVPTVTTSSSIEAQGWGKATLVDGATGSVYGALGYHSKEWVTDPTAGEWVQLDLGERRRISAVTLWPTPDPIGNSADAWGFPVDFRILVSDDPTFVGSATFLSASGVPNPGSQPQVSTGSTTGRYVRLEATRMGPTRPGNFGLSLTELTVASTEIPAPVAAHLGKPVISGTLRVGNTLMADVGDGSPGAQIAYRWYANGKQIAGATTASLTLTKSQLGKRISVRAYLAIEGQPSISRLSSTTATVKKGVLQWATPTISGVAQVGNTLCADPGVWTPGATIRYQWYINGSKITGATKVCIKIASSWKNKRLTVKVTGTKAGYTGIAKVSAPTAKITT